MNTTPLNSASAIAQYATSLLARQKAAAGASDTSAADAVQARLVATPVDSRTTTAQQALDRRQAALGKELSTGLESAGVKLDGEVSFSMEDGQVKLEGSDADKAKVQDWLDHQDPSRPGVQARVTGVLKDAQTLSSQTQQTNAISLAARYAGSAGNVMAMYNQFLGYQDATPATLTFAGGASSLHYPGALNSQA